MSPAEVDALVADAEFYAESCEGADTPWHRACARILRRLAALAARPAAPPVGEAERLRAWLRHDDMCEAAAWENRNRYHKPNYPRPTCSCGLDAVLASPAPQPAAPAPCPSCAHLHVKPAYCDRCEGSGLVWPAAAPAPVEPPPAEQPFWCDKQGNVEMARCVRPMGHAGDCLVPSPRLRGGGIISHAEIEDARKAQE